MANARCGESGHEDRSSRVGCNAAPRRQVASFPEGWRVGTGGREHLLEPGAAAIGTQLRLSWRESQVLGRVLVGEGESAIAERLGLSGHTVHTYFERLYRKLGVASRSDLILRIFAEYVVLRNQEAKPGNSLTMVNNRT